MRRLFVLTALLFALPAHTACAMEPLLADRVPELVETLAWRFLRGGAAAEVTYPVVSRAIEITDPKMRPYQWSGPNYENDVMTRIGQSLYFIFRSGDARAYIRRFEIEHGVFDNADFASHVTSHDLAQVFFDGEPRDGKADFTHNQYHAEPSLLRDGGGRLHPFFPIHVGGDTGRHGWQNAAASESEPVPDFPPLHRTIAPPISPTPARGPEPEASRSSPAPIPAATCRTRPVGPTASSPRTSTT